MRYVNPSTITTELGKAKDYILKRCDGFADYLKDGHIKNDKQCF